MKTLFGNPELIKENKRLAHLAAREASNKESEYEVRINYDISRVLETSNTTTLKILAYSEHDAIEKAEDQLIDNFDYTVELDSVKSKVVNMTHKAWRDPKTLNMFKN